MNTDRIEKKIVLRASLERVWNAISDAKQFGRLFGVDFDGSFVEGPMAKPQPSKTGDRAQGVLNSALRTLELEGSGVEALLTALRNGLGVAFTAVVNSFVSNLITPLIKAVFGGSTQFNKLAFTVNGSNTLAYINTHLYREGHGPGFEIGDLKTGKILHVVGMPNLADRKTRCHGVGLTPDEKELWLVDGPNNCLHVFDAAVMPPKQGPTIKLRDFPGWISFSMDGKFAYSSTGEIIDVGTRKIVAALKDETGREVQSEKLLDLVIANGKVIRAGNQFGVGMKR